MVVQVEKFFQKCYQKSVRDQANILIYSIRQNLRRFCGKKGSKLVKNYIKLGPCANKYAQQNDFCIAKFTNQTKQLINIKDDSKKIPHTCW